MFPPGAQVQQERPGGTFIPKERLQLGGQGQGVRPVSTDGWHIGCRGPVLEGQSGTTCVRGAWPHGSASVFFIFCVSVF